MQEASQAETTSSISIYPTRSSKAFRDVYAQVHARPFDIFLCKKDLSSTS